MRKETKRSVEMGRMLEEFAASGLGRREFCEQRRMPLTTFDYWRREHGGKKQTQELKQARRPRMVAVKISNAASVPHFTLGLANGRRIECAWRFDDAELARLIRVAEGA